MMFTWQVVAFEFFTGERMSVVRGVPIWFDGKWQMFPLTFVRLARLFR